MIIEYYNCKIVECAMNGKQIYEQMTREPIRKQIRILSFPAVAGALAFSFYNMIDSFFVAWLGTNALAAVGVTFFFVTMIQSLGYTVGMGAGSRMSKELGEKHKKNANQIAKSALILGAAIGIIVMVVGLLSFSSLITFMGLKKRVILWRRYMVHLFLLLRHLS